MNFASLSALSFVDIASSKFDGIGPRPDFKKKPRSTGARNAVASNSTYAIQFAATRKLLFMRVNFGSGSV